MSNKNTLNLVIIEDDDKQQSMYRDAIGETNAESDELEIVIFALKDDNELPRILYENRIDCIIVDIDWGRADADGNRVISKVIRDCRIPIIVISGNLSLLHEDYVETSIFRKYQRDVAFDEILKKIKEIYLSGYSRILGHQSKLDEMLRDLFWKYLVSGMNEFGGCNSDEKQRRLLRYAITRMNEMLMLTADNRLDIFHPAEVYITPPIKSIPFAGDIISISGNEYIIMSAACDMANRKADYILLCKIDSCCLDQIRNDLSLPDKEQRAKEQLRRLTNNNVPRYHLLPPGKMYQGGVVDYQHIQSMKIAELVEESKVVATVNPEFAKDIRARFSNYYGRQGQPQLDYEGIETMLREVKAH